MAEPLVVSDVIQSDREFDALWAEVHRDEIPDDELAAAHETILGQANRKMVYQRQSREVIGLTFPLGDYQPAIPPTLERITNYMLRDEVIIAKRYTPGEGSTAFIQHGFHLDPEEYFTCYNQGTIELLSLGGFAILLAKRSEQDKPIAVACRPNTRVVLIGNALHAVSPPLSFESFKYFCATKQLDLELGTPGPRTFMFGGRDYGSAEQQREELFRLQEACASGLC